MRLFVPFRSIATLLMAVGVATCSDAPSALVGTHPVPRRAVGRLGFEPQFSRRAQAVYDQRAAFDIHYDSVHVVIRGYPDTTVIVKDTTVFFTDTSSTLTLDIDVPVQTDDQRFNAALGYENGHDVVFYGSGVVQSHAPDKPAPPDQQTITINYAGPGSGVARIAISPKTSSIRADEAVAYTLTAFDSSNKSTAPPPIHWSVDNTSLASTTNESNTGATVVGRGISGTVTVLASSVSGLTDAATIQLASPPSGIVLVSGGGQTGKVHSVLPAPAVVRVVAADGGGVAGVTVLFSAPTGGSVGSSSVVTDGAGNASTSLTLGSASGTQGFAATALGFSVGITEHATAGDPSAITIVSGDAQADTVGHALKAPLVVKVADSFANPVAGVVVSWSRNGTGSLAAATSTTGSDGTASIGYTLGKTTGSDEIDATVNGVSGAANFTATAVAGGAAKIESVSGDRQTADAGKQLPAAFVVRVTDAGGNPVSRAAVTWSTTSGTITASTATDGTGVARDTLTLGKTVGDVTVTAAVAADKSVAFIATAVPGPAAATAFGTQPTSITAGSTMPNVTVTITDAYGNLTNASGSVTLALGSNPGNATLSGTLTRVVANGIATFDNLKLDKAGTGYTLLASGDGLTATSNTFNVTVGTPAKLAVIGPPSINVVAGTAGALPKLLVSDAGANPVANASIHVVIASVSPAKTIRDTTVTTDASGVFDLNQPLPQLTAAGQFTLTASVAGAQGSPAVLSANVTPAAAAKVVFATSPTSGAAGGPLSPQPQVAVIDAFGNAVTSATSGITLSIQPGTGTPGATLSGTTTVNAVNGVATFTDLSINRPGAGYCLQATAAGLTPSCTPPFPVNAGAASKLVILQQPAGGSAGTDIGSINVGITDANGNVLTNATASVTIVLATNPASGMLTGTLTHAAVNGVATFGGLSIDKAASGYVISASASGLASASTNAFTITAGLPAKLVFTTPPTSAQAGVAITPAIVVQLQDQFGNLAASATNPVVLGVASGPSSAQLSGKGPVNAQNGVATFSGVALNTAGDYTLSASSGTLTAATSASFAISAAAPSTLQASSSAFAVTAGGSISSGTVTLIDGSHNPIQDAKITFTLKQGTSEISGLIPRVLTTGALGTVSLADLTSTDLGNKAGTYDLEASTPGVAPIHLTLTIIPAAAAKLVITQQPSATAASGAVLAMQPVLQVQDQFGNATTLATPITATVSAGTLGGATSSTPSAAGVAAFTNLSITAPAGNVTLAFAPAPTSGVGPVTSSSIAITTGTASQLVLSPASPTAFIVSAGSTPASAPVIKSLDAGGNPVGNVPVHVVVDTGTAPATATVSAVDVATDASGVLAFAGAMPTIVGVYHVTVTSSAIPGASVTATVGITPGAAAKLAFIVPSGTTSYSGQAGSSSFTPGVAVAVEDQFGNIVINQPATAISLAIATNPAGGTLTNPNGTTSAGIAVFPSLSFDKAATGYTLTASATGLTGATSLPINISAGTASKLAFTTQPSTASANVAIAPPVSVQVQDQFGNVVGGAINQVTLAIASGTSGAGIIGNVVSANNGNASFPALSINLPGTAYTLSASATGLTSATSNSFAVTAASAASIALAPGSPPSATVIAGGTIATPPSVVVKDGTGKPVAGASVTLAVKNGSTTLTSQPATTDATGTVSFSALTAGDLPTTVGKYSIEASVGAVTPLPVGLTVSAGTASKIKLVPSNSAPPAGAEIGVVAIATDAFGNEATDNTTRTITWSISSGDTDGPTPTTMTSGSSLPLPFVTGASASTITATDQSSGLAQGSTTITPSAAGMSLTVSGAALATSATVNTSVGAPAVKVTTTGGAPVSGVMVKFSVVAGGGKVVSGLPVDAATKQTETSGAASVSAWNLGTTAGSRNNALQITAHGTSDVLTNIASATAGTASHLTISAVPAAVATNSSLGTITDTLQDSFGNTVTDASGTVTMSISGGGTLSPSASAPLTAGVATFSNLSILTSGSYTLTATYGSLTATSSTVNVTGQTATHLHFLRQPSNVTSLIPMSVPDSVELLDASNARVTSSNASVRLKLHSPGGGILTGDTATVVNGVAAFPKLTVDLAGTYTLDASSSGLTGETSGSFTVRAGAPAALTLSHGGGVDAPVSIPDDSTFKDNGNSGPKVQIVDAAGNVDSIPSITVNADVEADNISGAAAPGPRSNSVSFFAPGISIRSALTDASGVADFSGAKLKGSVGGLKIHFTAMYNGVTLTEIRSSHLNLTHGRAHSVTQLVALPGFVRPSHKLTMHPKVQVFDADGNFVDGSAVQFTFGGSGGGDQLGSSSSATVTTDANGFAETPDWTVGNEGTHVLHATIDGVTSDVSVTSAPAAHVSVSTRSLTGMKNGEPLPPIDVAVLTAMNDTLFDEVFPIVLTGSPHQTGKHIFNSSTVSSNTRGKSTFSGLSLDAEEQTGGALVFSVSGESFIKTDSVTFDSILPGDADAVDNGSGQTTFSVGVGQTISGASVPSVQVKDKNRRNSVSSTTVMWTVTSCTVANALSLASATSQTDASGTATSPAITGLLAGTCTLQAQASALPQTNFTITILPR